MTDTALPLKMAQSTADSMLKMLQAHYLPEYRLPEGIFAPEIQAPGYSGRRADLIWQGVTGRARELVGHEIKVTRQDLRHELANPEKCVPWKRYCDRWWLVVPDLSITEGLEIPDDWGIMLPPSGRRTRSMTVVRQAPKLAPEPQAPAMQTIAIWLFWRHHRTNSDLKLARSYNDRQRQHIEQLQQRVHELEAAADYGIAEVVR